MQEHSWEVYKKEGLQFLNAAIKGHGRKEIFTPMILYNILSMAIEKLFMAFLTYHKSLPDNHTLNEMVAAVEKIRMMDPELSRTLSRMDQAQLICNLEIVKRKEITEQDIQDYLDAGIRVKLWVLEDIHDI